MNPIYCKHVSDFLTGGNWDIVKIFAKEKGWLVENCGFYVDHSMEQYLQITVEVERS